MFIFKSLILFVDDVAQSAHAVYTLLLILDCFSATTKKFVAEAFPRELWTLDRLLYSAIESEQIHWHMEWSMPSSVSPLRRR